MDIQYDYKREWQEIKTKTALLIDNSIIQEGLRRGFSSDEIKNEVMKNSPYMREMTKETKENYINKFKFEEKSSVLNTGFSYHDTLAKYKNTITALYIKNELKVVEKLLSKGYKNFEIQNAIKNYTPFFKDFNISIKSPQYINYINKVLENIPYRDHDPKLLEIADMYKKQIAFIKNKNTNAFINEYVDGKIALDLYFNQNVPLNILHKVYLKSENRSAIQPQYADKIINSLKRIKQKYDKIDNFNKKTALSAQERYLLYTKQYRHYQNKKVLNGKDEQQVIKRMFSENLSVEDIKKALSDLSPIAVYPGREAKRYINTTIEVVEKEYTELKKRAQQHYMKVSSLFDEELKKINNLKQLDINRQKQQQDKFYYGILAKNLLNQNCYPQYIIDNFEKKIPQLNIKSSNNNYIYAIVNSAQKSLENERAIKNFISPYKFYEMTLKEIKEKNISLTDVFKSVIKERLDIYPNIALDMNRKFIDRDAVVKLLNRYPDIQKHDLTEAVSNASIYNKLPGVTIDYPTKIVEEAIQKFTEANKALEEEKTNKQNIKNDFDLYKDIATGAVRDVQENQKEYCDCKAAVSMINRKVYEMDIKNILADESDKKELSEKYKYADSIYEKAQKIIAREIQIINHIPNRNSVEDIYKTYMKDMYLKRKYFSAELDVKAAKKMLNDNIKKEDIAAVLIKHSPISAEPNRGRIYTDNYVIRQAQNELDNEKEKIKNYQPKLRREIDPVSAYRHHYNDFKNVIDLPFSKEADIIIAATMLLQNFTQNEIEKTITEQSPLSSKDAENLAKNTYGKEIVSEAQNMTQSKERTNELVRQHEKTKEET